MHTYRVPFGLQFPSKAAKGKAKTDQSGKCVDEAEPLQVRVLANIKPDYYLGILSDRCLVFCTH
jgi:hypothetical protein